MVIYKTTNLSNGKIYVGKDCGHPSGYLGSGTILKKAIKKYGRENFKKEILETCDLSNINEREKYWIAKLNARNPKIGYNITAGGDGAGFGKDNTFYGKKHSDETKRRISEGRTGEKNPFFGKFGEDHPWFGHHHSDETCEKLSIYSSGENNPMFGMSGEKSPNFGKHLSDEQKAKISAANKGKVRSEEVKKHLSEINTGKIPTIETRMKMSQSGKGRKFSEEHKKKLVEALREYWHQKHIEKNPNYDQEALLPKIDKRTIPRKGEQSHRFGTHMSPEIKAKISASLKGKVRPPRSKEHSLKISQALKKKYMEEQHPMVGKHLSPETLQKISNTKKINFNKKRLQQLETFANPQSVLPQDQATLNV